MGKQRERPELVESPMPPCDSLEIMAIVCKWENDGMINGVLQFVKTRAESLWDSR